MEEPVKYDVDRQKLSSAEVEDLTEVFKRAGRKSIELFAGDLVVTQDMLIQHVGSDLAVEKALELLYASKLTMVYPVDSAIEFPTKSVDQ